MKKENEKYYKIGEVAEMLGVHEDTLRNWDEQGLVIADRVGTRKDRRYTAEHIKQIKEKGLVSDLSRRQPARRDYSDYTKEQLIKELQLLSKQRKYGLVWEDKLEEVVERCKREAPILKSVSEMSVAGKEGEQKHIMIEGDNYHALQVLNYTHKGKIDVIYIDPPYNTGNQSWVYNNSYVEKDDQFRHSKWLSFMTKRLWLAKHLLKDDGLIVTTIDDYELFTLGLLMDDIFLEQNRIGFLVVESNPRGRTTNKFFATSHEYWLVYAKNIEKAVISNLPLTDEQEGLFKFEDDISKYRLLPFRRSGGLSTPEERPNSYYPIYYDPKRGKIDVQKDDGLIEILPIDNAGGKRVWRQTKPSLMQAVERGDIVIKEGRSGYVVYMKDRIKQGRKAKTVWIDPKYDASSHGTVLVDKILGKRNSFDYPKSIFAVLDILDILSSDKKEAVILDFFAGSGTAGHAVLELNKKDGGNRQFILCTNNENNNGNGHGGVAEGVCQPRIKKVMKGYKKKGSGEKVEGLGGSLEYLKTEFVDVEHVDRVPDRQRLEFTHEAGHVIALKENTFTELEKNDWYQIFTDEVDKYVGIYFRENLKKLEDLEKKILEKMEVKLYIFSHGSTDDWKNDYAEYENVSVEDIPEPILRVYKNLNL